MEKVFLKTPNVITSVSKSSYNEYFQKTKCNIYFIPNGVRSDLLNEDIDKQNYLLFTAARIIPIKGCDILLKALNKLQYKEQVIIVGDLHQNPNYRKEIEHYVAKLNVRLTGLIKNDKKLFQIIGSSSLFIFPSLMEAMPITLLEAAALRVPIICSDIDACITIFENHEVLFFKSGNVDDLANKIQWALGHRDEMYNKSINAYEKVKSKYSWEKIALEYDNIYKALSL